MNSEQMQKYFLAKIIFRKSEYIEKGKSSRISSSVQLSSMYVHSGEGHTPGWVSGWILVAMVGVH